MYACMKTLYNQHACGQQQNLRLTFMLLPVAMLATARTLEAYKKPVSCLHQQFILQPPVDTTHSDSTRCCAFFVVLLAACVVAAMASHKCSRYCQTRRRLTCAVIAAPRALRRLPHHAPSKITAPKPHHAPSEDNAPHEAPPKTSSKYSEDQLHEKLQVSTKIIDSCKQRNSYRTLSLQDFRHQARSQSSLLSLLPLRTCRSPQRLLQSPDAATSIYTALPVPQEPDARAETPLLTLTLGSPRRPLAAVPWRNKFRSPVNEPISRTSSPPYHLPTLPCSLLHVAATPAMSAASSAGDYRRTSSPPHHLPTLSCSRVATSAVSAAPTRPLVIAAHVPRASRYAHSPHPLPCW
nr:uncharacterized protein LOC113803716 [Penaeus vannamei]